MSVIIQFTASVHFSKWERRAIRDSTNDVGYEDEAYPTRTMGDLLRSKGCLDSRQKPRL